MKVWVAIEGDYSDQSVYGVYSSLEIAQAVADRHDDVHVINTDGYEVDGDEVVASLSTGLTRFSVCGDIDSGSIFSVYRSGPATHSPATFEVQSRVDNPVVIVPERMVVRCAVRDKEHAVKVWADMRAQVLASRRTE